MSPQKQFEFTSLRMDTKDQHLYFFEDKCQYVKNGSRGEKIYYKCKVAECPKRGTLRKDVSVFVTRNEHSQHENHEEDYEFEKLKVDLKNAVRNTNISIEKCVVEQLKK